MILYISLNTVILSEQSSALHSITTVQSTMNGMFINVKLLLHFNEELKHVYKASQTHGELSGVLLPVIIISVTLNILFIASLIIIMIVFITVKRKSGRGYYACASVNRYILYIQSSRVYNIQCFMQCISSSLQSCTNKALSLA